MNRLLIFATANSLAAIWGMPVEAQQALTVPCWLGKGGQVEYDRQGLPPIPRSDSWVILGIDLPAVRGACVIQQQAAPRTMIVRPRASVDLAAAAEATRMAEQSAADNLRYRQEMDRRACREAVDRAWAQTRFGPMGCASSFDCTEAQVHKYDVCP